MRILIFIALLCVAAQGRGQIYINSYRFEAAAPATLILDDYPGAAIAYSFRKLDVDYGDSCIIVRRSSDNTTQRIGFVSNYLDTASMKTFCGTGATNNCFVNTWYDQSGNNRNAVMTTEASQPTIMENGVILKNGNFVYARFDATNDFLDINNPISNVNVNSSHYQSFVGRKTADNRILGFLSSKTSGSDYVLTLWSDQKFYLYGSSTQIFGATNNTSNTSVCLVTGQNAAGTLSVHINGSSVAGSSTSASGTRALNTVGRYSSYMGDHLFESVFYLSNQSANRSGIETNINAFYSIY